jgi:hypothetical protein
MSAFHTHLLRLSAAISLCATALSGCKAETAEEFEGTPETKEVAWAAGQDLSVTGANGEIRFERGNAGKVGVQFKPFAIEGYSEEDKARADMREHLHFALAPDSRGVGAAVHKTGGGGGLGAHMLVYLPPEFDSTINIENDNGEVEVDFVGNAHTLYVRNDGAGDCLVTPGQTTSIKTTNVLCNFDVRVAGVSDAVIVRSAELGDVDVSIASVAPGSAQDQIRADNGTVNLALPAAGGFSVQATASGTVNQGNMPSTCSVQEAAANSKTVACGGGRNYVVHAGENVNLSYH